MDGQEMALNNIANRLKRLEQASITGGVFYKILKSLTIVIAAMIAPLAYLTRKPLIPAVLGSVIVIAEALQLVFRFHEDWMLRRIRSEQQQLNKLSRELNIHG